MSEYKTRDAVAAKLRAICVETLCLDVGADQIRDDSRLVEDLNLDSLDRVELSIFVEDDFGLEEISEPEVETFGQLVDLVCAKLDIEVQA